MPDRNRESAVFTPDIRAYSVPTMHDDKNGSVTNLVGLLSALTKSELVII